MVEILSLENLNNAKILKDFIQNIKGLLSLGDLRVKHLSSCSSYTKADSGICFAFCIVLEF